MARSVKIALPNPSLVVLCGPAGAGKSTFAQRHLRRTQIISSDRCRAMVGDNPADLSLTKDAFDLLYYLAHKRLKLRRLTAIDSTALARHRRARLLAIAREHRVPAILIVFDVDAETCRLRNAERRRRVPDAAIRAHERLLRATLQTVSAEGFDQLYILQPSTPVTVEIQPAPATVSQPSP